MVASLPVAVWEPFCIGGLLACIVVLGLWLAVLFRMCLCVVVSIVFVLP